MDDFNFANSGLTGIVTAGVPNRIIYQGRLFKSGVGISGEKSIRLTLVKADGKTVVDTKSFSVTLPATGEFTIVWDLEKEIDWRGDQPELKVEVDTDELTPRQQFSASPLRVCGQAGGSGGGGYVVDCGWRGDQCEGIGGRD
jgi:hypothetical protein